MVTITKSMTLGSTHPSWDIMPQDPEEFKASIRSQLYKVFSLSPKINFVVNPEFTLIRKKPGVKRWNQQLVDRE